MVTRTDSNPTKAALAAQARAQKRAALEAEALRDNLRRRKAQARARAGQLEGREKCP